MAHSRGSSDAASVLLALNRPWNLELPRAKLHYLAQTLRTYWLAHAFPRVYVHTADIFAAPELTRSTPSAKMDVFSVSYGQNDLAAVTCARFPKVATAIAVLSHAAPQVRMTGSGSCVFAACSTEREARDAIALLPPHIDGHLARHPLVEFAR